MVSYYVCGSFMYTIYVSHIYVLGYNIQGLPRVEEGLLYVSCPFYSGA